MGNIPCFTGVPTDVHKYTTDGTAVLILLYLCDKIDHSKGSIAWPSYSTIEKDLNLARSTISKKLKLLESVGLLTIQSGDRSKSNRYEPNFRKRIGSVKIELGSSQIELASSNILPQVVVRSNCNKNHYNNNQINKIYRKSGKHQITEEELKNLKEVYNLSKVEADDLIDGFLNYSGKSKYVSIYQTIIKWHKKTDKYKDDYSRTKTLIKGMIEKGTLEKQLQEMLKRNKFTKYVYDREFK